MICLRSILWNQVTLRDKNPAKDLSQLSNFIFFVGGKMATPTWKLLETLPSEQEQIFLSTKTMLQRISKSCQIIELLSVTRTGGPLDHLWTLPFQEKRCCEDESHAPQTTWRCQSKQDSSLLRVSKAQQTHIPKKLCKTQRTDSNWIRNILQTRSPNEKKLRKLEILGSTTQFRLPLRYPCVIVTNQPPKAGINEKLLRAPGWGPGVGNGWDRTS